MAKQNTENAVLQKNLTHSQKGRAVGSIIGAAVADALGAPFEFGPEGQYLRRFPRKVRGGIGEMIGGGSFNWKPGEFTDDTQMAMALAESLILCGNLNPPSVWTHFQAWYEDAVDVGINTSRVLRQNEMKDAAKKAHLEHGKSASNGSIMRIAPIGVFGVTYGRDETIQMAIQQSDITHFDRAAAAGAAIVAEVIRRCIVTGDFLGALNDQTFEAVAVALGTEGTELVAPYRELLSESYDPHTYEGHSNGSAWIATAQAVWAIRTTRNFHDAIVAAIELGGDTDTVAAITGSMAGAIYGIQGIPIRWVTYVNGSVRMPDGSTKNYRSQDLINIARCLLGLGNAHMSTPEKFHPAGKVDALGVWAANLDGATTVDTSFGVVSLCLVGDRFREHEFRRLVFLRDESLEQNPGLAFVLREAVEAVNAFLEEGKQVVVHCHGGHSRTALVLKAWFMLTHNVSHAEAHGWLNDTWPLYETWNDSFWDHLENEWTEYVNQVWEENQ